jgi:hypothetical protein
MEYSGDPFIVGNREVATLCTNTLKRKGLTSEQSPILYLSSKKRKSRPAGPNVGLYSRHTFCGVKIGLLMTEIVRHYLEKEGHAVQTMSDFEIDDDIAWAHTVIIIVYPQLFYQKVFLNFKYIAESNCKIVMLVWDLDQQEFQTLCDEAPERSGAHDLIGLAHHCNTQLIWVRSEHHVDDLKVLKINYD